jgi:protein-tyrosine phosphatase
VPIIEAVGHVELHFHLLAGIDDGPATLDESVELAAAAVADGTGIVVATPHVHPEHVTDPELIRDRARELVARLARERIGLEVCAGGELSHLMVGRLSGRELELIAHGPAGRRWLLLETPFDGADGDFADAADELRGRGFGLVIAHPERARQTPETAATIRRELAVGSTVQITAAALSGGYGPAARKAAVTLLAEQPSAIISSDAHGPRAGRMPGLTAALAELRRLGDFEPVRRVDATPRTLLEHGIVARADPRAA